MTTLFGRRFTASAVSALFCLVASAAAHATTWVNTSTQAIPLAQVDGEDFPALLHGRQVEEEDLIKPAFAE